MPTTYLIEPIVERLAWTLGHFLWQGLAIATMLVLTVEAGRFRRSQVRYTFSLIALVAMFIAPITTFVVLSNAGATTGNFPFQIEQQTIDIESDNLEEVELHSGRGGMEIQVPHSRWYPEAWIVTGWLVGVSLFSGRLFCGWIGVLRLKRQSIATPDWLEERAQRIARLMNLVGARLRLSSTVPEAIAVGFLKPMILLPVTWVTEVPVDMLEAIIAHELAHIRRGDLWVNLFQRVVESIFFFHPAVWWLSRRIHMEREFCSDDVAVAVLQCPLRYAETLEYVGRLSHSSRHVSLAISMGGTKSILLRRVLNVLRKPEGSSSLGWAAGVIPFATVGLIWWSTAVFHTNRVIARDPVASVVSPQVSAEVMSPPASAQSANSPAWWREPLEPRPVEIPSRPPPPNPWEGWQDDTVQYNAEVAAIVNGKPILKGEVLNRYSSYLLELRRWPSKIPTPKDYANIRELFVQSELPSHIQRRVVIDRVNSRLTADEIDAIHRQCESRFETVEIEKLKRELKVATQADLEAELRHRETSLEATKQGFISEWYAMNVIHLLLPQAVPISRDDIAAYYNSHSEEFAEAAAVTWDEVQVSFESAEKKDAAHQKIKLAQQELQTDVAFVDVAEKYSDGRTARTDGRWEKMAYGTLKDQKLEQLLFEMPFDTLSEIYEGESQFRLVIVRNRRKAGIAPLDDVAEQIREKLGSERTRSNYETLFRELFAEAVIETKYELAVKKPKN